MKVMRLEMLAMTVVSIVAMAGTAHALPALQEYAFNIDGTVSNITLGDSTPPGVDLSLFDATTGLGQVTVNFTTAAHSARLFVDHDIDAVTNGYTNESGEALGSPTPGQTWEIDEPGFGVAYTGDIYDNFAGAVLGNDTLVTIYGPPFSTTPPEDISMGIGMTASGPSSVIFALSETDPGSGFRLRHFDPDSQGNIYFSATQTAIPEPGSFLLCSVVLGGAFALRRWRKRRQS